MSICDWGLFIIFALFMIVGFCRGLLKEVAAILLVIVPLAAAFFISPYIARTLERGTGIGQGINRLVNESLLKDGTAAGEELTNKGSEADEKDASATLEQTAEAERKSGSDGVNADERSTKNDYVKQYLHIFNKGLLEEVSQPIIDDISHKIIEYISFILVYLVFYLSISVAYMGLNIMTKVPILSGFNRFFGAVLGLIKAVLLISVLMLTLPILYLSVKEVGQLMRLIDESVVAKQLYDNNIIIMIGRMLLG